MTMKIHSRKQERQADLNQKRELLDQIVERMNDLAQVTTIYLVLWDPVQANRPT
jgi:hypothetical protein